MKPHGVLTLVLAVATTAIATACAGVGRPQAQVAPAPPGVSMWVPPKNLATHELYYGPWGREAAPVPDAPYRLVEIKHTGTNLGMTVLDPQGREWSVKQAYPGGLDPEAPVEVVLSRLLSAIGYHQPPVYFLPAFNLKDDFGTHVEIGGRFRLSLEGLEDRGAWKWEDNPFVGSKPYQGLIVLLMLFNSTDLKNSNNTLYERRRGDFVEQWYTVRDIGAALGDTAGIAPRKNHIDSFAASPFILGASGGFVEFAYHGWYKNLVTDRITPADVAWASALLGQLSDGQWADAFRAGGYEPAVADRFITALRARIKQGQALESVVTSASK